MHLIHGIIWHPLVQFTLTRKSNSNNCCFVQVDKHFIQFNPLFVLCKMKLTGYVISVNSTLKNEFHLKTILLNHGAFLSLVETYAASQKDCENEDQTHGPSIR